MGMRAGLMAVALMMSAFLGGTGRADVAAPGQVLALSELLQIGPALDVMAEEGRAYGQDLREGMFPDQGAAGWDAVVVRIYDPEVMRQRFDAAFVTALAGSGEVGAIQDFFGSPLGLRALTLEVSARRALLDADVEAAAKLAYAEMVAAGDPRVAGLRRFVEVNDLIESNVMGALNANLAFYRGLAEGAEPGQSMPEDDMLSEVWAQEAQVRADTEEWLLPFLALAYRPLSDADLAAYAEFSDTPAGQEVNSALFAAFDAVFVAVSRDLGRAVARQMQGQAL